MKLADWHDAIPFAAAVYGRENGGAGCCLHIALDDGNFEDSSIKLCLEWAVEKGHPECIACAEIMSRMSLTQRNRLYRSSFDGRR